MDLELRGERDVFVELEEIVLKIQKKGYVAGPQTGGAGFEEGSKEFWRYQWVDETGKEVLLYSFQKINGSYQGTLKTNLPPDQQSEFEEQARGLIALLSNYANDG